MRQRLLDYERAFAHPVTVWICVGVGALLVIALIAVVVAPFKPETRDDIRRRTISWIIMVPLIVGPILLGAGTLIAAVTILSLLCFREFSRATGEFRDRAISLVVVLGILLLAFAALDTWYRLFVALFPLTVVLIAATAIGADQPKGYIQRVGLGVFGFMLFGGALAHLSFMSNAPDYRPRVLLLLAAVQLNDVFAYCWGKALGRRKLAPNTSPNKTVAGSLGAIATTTTLVALVGRYVYAGTELDHPLRLVILGFMLSVTGQLGDLMLSSIKRDLGIKDMGAAIPGHGGVLDRANSVLLSAPAYFHYVGYFVGFGQDAQGRWLL